MNKKVIKIVKTFDSSNPGWTANKEYNQIYVKAVLNYCYEKFKSRGYLFLNEVYQDLGFPMTREGQIAGWVFSKDTMKDCMWGFWTKNDGYDDVYITFEPLSTILDILPNESEEL